MSRRDVRASKGYLSDESSFYGDSPTRLAFEKEAKNFDISVWWKNNHNSPTTLANDLLVASRLTEKSKVDATLHNPYEDIWSGRQLHETIDEFLERVPPSTTPVSAEDDWIWIANPLADGLPPDDGWTKFVIKGSHLLDDLDNSKEEIEKQKAGRFMVISDAVRDTERKLQRLAAELHCTTGKWLLFPSVDDVDAVWKVVARGTAQGDLGISAKVLRDGGNTSNARVICIYTKDFTDLEDVGRVARQMKELGLIHKQGRPVYYKCDAYTYLHLNSGNEYGIKASLYNSNEMLKPKERKLGTFSEKRKRSS